jgi:hypothetical protein
MQKQKTHRRTRQSGWLMRSREWAEFPDRAAGWFLRPQIRDWLTSPYNRAKGNRLSAAVRKK